MSHFSFIHLLTAVFFFLYGLRTTERGLRQATGDRLRSQLHRLTRRRFSAFLLGVIMTVVFQSATATTSMLVGLAGIGLLSLRQAFPVVLGADLGTALLVVVLASVVRFDATDFSLTVLLLGFLATFLLKKGRRQFFAEALLGFGFVFFGLTLLRASSLPLRESELARQLISVLSGNHLGAVVIAAVFTGLLQSSAAVIGVLLSLTASGTITAVETVPFILGANLGGTFGPLIASTGAQVEGKRLAHLHVMTKLLGVAAALPFAEAIGEAAGAYVETPSYQVAAVHILFNGAVAVVFFPLAGMAAGWISAFVKPADAREEFGAKYLDPHSLDSPTLAFANVFREILRMAEIAQEMCTQALVPFEEPGRETMERLEELDDQIDRLDKEIKFYLAKMAQTKLTDEQARRELELLVLTHDLESVGDVVCKDLLRLAEKKRRRQVSFSAEGWEEIRGFHRAVLENFQLAITSFATGSVELGQKVVRQKRQVAQMEQDLSQRHLMRLHQGYRESIETSSLHLDILSNLRRINSIISKMAYPVLDRRAPGE